MQFMFSTLYRVTQKDFYAQPYTSMWAPVVQGASNMTGTDVARFTHK